MYKICFITALVFLLSCKSNTEETTASDTTSIEIKDTSPAKTNTSVTGCYLRVIQRDTLIASLVQDGDYITGQLVFDNYEKDGSRGTVSGIIEGDIVKLIYRFQSEGMNSISETYFKLTGEGLIQGIGDVNAKGDSSYYSQPGNISYPAKDVLKKTDCSQLNLQAR